MLAIRWRFQKCNRLKLGIPRPSDNSAKGPVRLEQGGLDIVISTPAIGRAGNKRLWSPFFRLRPRPPLAVYSGLGDPGIHPVGGEGVCGLCLILPERGLAIRLFWLVPLLVSVSFASAYLIST